MTPAITATKMSSGLAFTPHKDLELFSQMAAQGKHLTGVSSIGHSWTFTDGPPENAIFDLAYEAHPTQEYFEIFEAAGWTHVLSMGDVQIFKAPPGTVAVHTSAESRFEELGIQRSKFARYSMLTLSVFAVVLWMLKMVSWHPALEQLVLVLSLIPVVYTVFPLVGYIYRLQRS